MVSLFEQMAAASRDLARTQRRYVVTVNSGNGPLPVTVWAINAPDAINKALDGREFNGNELRVSARLVG